MPWHSIMMCQIDLDVIKLFETNDVRLEKPKWGHDGEVLMSSQSLRCAFYSWWKLSSYKSHWIYYVDQVCPLRADSYFFWLFCLFFMGLPRKQQLVELYIRCYESCVHREMLRKDLGLCQRLSMWNEIILPAVFCWCGFHFS